MARRIEDVLINVLGAQQLQLAQNAAVIESLQEALAKVEADKAKDVEVVKSNKK